MFSSLSLSYSKKDWATHTFGESHGKGLSWFCTDGDNVEAVAIAALGLSRPPRPRLRRPPLISLECDGSDGEKGKPKRGQRVLKALLFCFAARFILEIRWLLSYSASILKANTEKSTRACARARARPRSFVLLLVLCLLLQLVLILLLGFSEEEDRENLSFPHSCSFLRLVPQVWQ